MILKRREGSKSPKKKKEWTKLKYEYRQVEHSRTAMLTSSERDTMNIDYCDELNLCCGGGQLGVHLETLYVPLKDAAA